MENVIKLNESKQAAFETDKAVLVDFYALGTTKAPNISNTIDSFTCAKTETYENRSRYAIRIDNNHRLFDPLGMFAERQVRASEIRFKNVTKECFDLYIKYLVTRNKVWLANAERKSI
jgi:hypothetical protein